MKKKFLSLLIIFGLIFALFSLSSCEKESGLSDNWKENALESYTEFMSEVEDNENRIPIIVTTDQHGSITSNSEIYSYINEITNWDNISKIINLGDTVRLIYNKSDLKNYENATSMLPNEKRIEVIGNHDRVLCLNKEKAKDTYFENFNAIKNEENNAFSIKDETYNVKYLVLDPETYPWSYKSGRLTKSQADFIISELSNDSDMDIVFLSHPYIFKDDMIKRTGEHFTGSDYFIGSDSKYSDVKESFLDMLKNRKEKGSGVLLDCDYNEHPYDFSNCDGDFLMTLHGHHHTEGYETKDGITEFLFQSVCRDNEDDSEPNCIYFAYIDREEKIFKCWKVVASKYEPWTISIK